MVKNRVCFISVYFGKIPYQMRMFFDSCEWNEKFDWLFVYDDEFPFEEISSNIKLLKLSKEKFRKRLNNVTELNIKNFEAYKVCDFRPAYGEIFSEELKDYEFWGISDTDMLLGKLDDFISEELLNNYDKIFTVGHLSIIRNTPEINSAYKRKTEHSRDYDVVFTNSLSCIYDEYEGFTEKFEDQGYRVYKEKVCADVYSDHGRIKISTKKRVALIQYRNTHLEYCEKKNYRYQLFTLNKGKVIKYFICKGKLLEHEYSYIHKIYFKNITKVLGTEQYIITSNGLVCDNDLFTKIQDRTLSVDDINKYNKRNTIKEVFSFLCFYIRLKIRRIRKKFFPRENEI